MKIAIDATFSPHGGSLGHLLEFIEGISDSHPKSDFFLYTKEENIELIGADLSGRCTIKIIRMASFGNFFRLVWGQFILPFYAKLDGVDVLFCPGNISPFIKTTKVKAQWIATVGPFVADTYEALNAKEKCFNFINKIFILISGYTSNVVIHESIYSQQLFEGTYRFAPKKQFLIECGKDKFFTPFSGKIDSSNRISQITNNDLLYVSHMYPYKNVERLIEALYILKKSDRFENKLYIVGKIGDEQYVKNLEKLIDERHLKNDIIFTGLATKVELRFAYSNCKLFVFPSLCESSGYTLIEAMSCGAAVLASDRTAIPFTCKEGAKYFDARSVEDLAVKLQEILSDRIVLEQMEANSLGRARKMIDYQTATGEFLRIVCSVT